MLVTVGVPTLSRLSYLQEAVASALSQTHPELEVIISDDGTSSELAAWARTVEQGDRRVRYQRTRGRVGLAGNWNAVADAAKGEYTVIIGDDDKLLPDFVATLLESGRAADVIFSNHYWIDEKGHRLVEVTRTATTRYGRDKLPVGPLADPAHAVWENAVPMSASLVRTNWLRNLRFKEDVNAPELEFFARLVQAGGTFAFCSDYLAEYRVHGGQETARGLTFDRLAAHLAAVPVSDQLTATKRATIESLMLGAVSAAIQRGDVGTARHLVRSKLYPRWRVGNSRLVAQVLAAHLPKVVGTRMYRLLAAARRAARTEAGVDGPSRS